MGLIDLYKAHPFGICVDTTEPKELADTLLNLINEDNLLKIRKSNMQFAKENFDPSVIAKNIENILIDSRIK